MLLKHFYRKTRMLGVPDSAKVILIEYTNMTDRPIDTMLCIVLCSKMNTLLLVEFDVDYLNSDITVSATNDRSCTDILYYLATFLYTK